MNDVLATIEQFRHSLPEFIHTLPEKNAPAIWLPREQAITHERIRPYLNDRHYVMLDYDNPNDHSDNHTRYDIEPNFLVYNPVNGHHQAFWRLSDPVHCQEASKNRKPYQLLRAIESAFDDKYGGDHRFARYIARNPLYHGADTDWRHNRGHRLAELAEVVDLNQHRVRSGNKTPSGEGRNCTLFDELRRWAYKQDTTSGMPYNVWLQRCLTQAMEYNSFKNPLGASEVRSIARSVGRYTYHRRHFDESFSEYVNRTHTSEIQAKRGAIGGAKSKGGGRPPLGEPWAALNISRATYFRRKKAGLL